MGLPGGRDRGWWWWGGVGRARGGEVQWMRRGLDASGGAPASPPAPASLLAPQSYRREEREQAEEWRDEGQHERSPSLEPDGWEWEVRETVRLWRGGRRDKRLRQGGGGSAGRRCGAVVACREGGVGRPGWLALSCQGQALQLAAGVSGALPLLLSAQLRWACLPRAPTRAFSCSTLARHQRGLPASRRQTRLVTRASPTAPCMQRRLREELSGGEEDEEAGGA